MTTTQITICVACLLGTFLAAWLSEKLEGTEMPKESETITFEYSKASRSMAEWGCMVRPRRVSTCQDCNGRCSDASGRCDDCHRELGNG